MNDSSITVLLIEDDLADTDLIREMLADASGVQFGLRCARRLSTALEHLERGNIDLALVDLTLPDSQGLETFTAARLRAPHVPMIVLSGLEDEGLAIEAVREGAQDYLVKDQVTGQLLVRAIRYAIERKRGQEEREELLAMIQTHARRVQQIIDTVSEGVLLLDIAGRILLANPAGEGQLALLGDARVGEVLTHMSDRPLSSLLEPPPEGLCHQVTTGEHCFEVIAHPIETIPAHDPKGDARARSADPAGGWVLVIRDVTQQREIEKRVQQQERLAAVGQLAAGIAHDFNNVMAVITLCARMTIRTPDLPSQTYERLEVISQQARHASNLIRQILDFSRRSVLKRQPVNLLEFLEEQVELLDCTLPDSIRIDLDVSAEQLTVHADPTRLQQVVVNLATNARDAMPHGGVLQIGLEHVRVNNRARSPLPEMEPGEWARITVADTGDGIPPDVLPRIFDPFFTTKPPGLGTGLGLSQVYGIVKQHQGYVDVTSEPGKGATFTLYLPALNVRQSGETVLDVVSPAIEGEDETVLLVEDDLATQQALTDGLESLGYRVLRASNGREALAVFERYTDSSNGLTPIALVLTDLMMPEMDGQTLFRELKRRDPQIPVVAVTAYPLEKKRIEALRVQGLKGWLSKPVSLEHLAAVIDRALRA